MTQTLLDKIVNFLDHEKINYQLTIHEPVRTSEEAAKLRGVPLSSGAKAMVVKCKSKYYLFVLRANTKLDWKKVKVILNNSDAHLAPIEEAEKITGVQIGAVAPFGNLMGLPTYFDKKLLQNIDVNFNAGLRTHSINMKTVDLVTLVKPIVEDFSG
ncbi:MAG: YbaK/EbsC family protein [Patescibacteria group bacterium]